MLVPQKEPFWILLVPRHGTHREPCSRANGDHTALLPMPIKSLGHENPSSRCRWDPRQNTCHRPEAEAGVRFWTKNDSTANDVKKLAKDWAYDVVSIGFPGPVLHGRPVAEPHNLGCGWTGFNFASAFGFPARVANDAAMQALGSYRGGRMLFLGLGTGLGSAMIVNGIVEPMELGHLPYKKGTYEDYVGDRGLDHDGKKR